MNKRAMSVVVGTMLVVLLTIIVAAVLWVVIKNVSDINKGSSQDCLTLDLEVISCGYAATGCYNLWGDPANPNWLQVPDPAQVGGGLPGIAWAVIRRNQGHGDLETAKFILEVAGQRVAGDLTDYNLPQPLNYRPRKDLSGLKEFAVVHIASVDLAGSVPIIVSNPLAIVYATIAPVVKGGIICDADEKLVPCGNLDGPSSPLVCQTCPCYTCGNGVCEGGIETPAICGGPC